MSESDHLILVFEEGKDNPQPFSAQIRAIRRFASRVLKMRCRGYRQATEVEALRAEIETLKSIVAGLADRVAGQSELLSRRANRNYFVQRKERNVIVPSIGRIVWYYPAGAKPGEQPWPAIIAHVWSDTCVNLAIFNANGFPMATPPTSVLLVQEGSEVPSGGNYCCWMPYQQRKAREENLA